MSQFVFDELTQLRHLKAKEKQKERQKTLDWLKEQEKYIVKLDSSMPFDPTNADNQIGQGLSSNDFELKLKRLLPDVFVMQHPQRPWIRWLFSNDKGERKFVCSYDGGFMPEHSILKSHEEEIPDVDFVAGRRSIERKDLPQWEFVPEKGIVFDPTATKPGFKKVKQVWGESKRGWRTVLIYMVKQHLVTPTQVENVFGSDNTLAWSSHLGKTSVLTPW